MEGSLKDLSNYRFETAMDELDAAKVLLETGKFKASVNRSYYAIFHALRAVTALDGFDSSKHSGIIAFFNKNNSVYALRRAQLCASARISAFRSSLPSAMEISRVYSFSATCIPSRAVLGPPQPSLVFVLMSFSS